MSLGLSSGRAADGLLVRARQARGCPFLAPPARLLRVDPFEDIVDDFPQIPAWPLPFNEWFGDIKGPNASHGGFYAHERPWIKLIQAALIRKGYARWLDGTRVVAQDPVNNTWVDGVYGPETIRSVAAWQSAHMPGTTYFGQVWWDDWAKLLA